jgi:hypothetical protein
MIHALDQRVVRESAGVSDRPLCLPEYLPVKEKKKGDAVETQLYKWKYYQGILEQPRTQRDIKSDP